jgi:CubicO group peptidase (beta-lactamase class C family)
MGGVGSFAEARLVLERAVEARAFPAAVVEVGRAGHPIWRGAFGRLAYDPGAPPAREDSIFDLASLTKVLATATIVMREVEAGRIGLDDPVALHAAAWTGRDRAGVTIRDLLAHCSGLPAHRPLYRECRGSADYLSAIGRTPLEYEPRSRSLYSDLGFILLGIILERYGPLPHQFDAIRPVLSPSGELRFHPPLEWKPRTAPAQRNAWRGRLLRGEVDDDNAWALGGAAGHAGLFGTAAAVGDCARHFLQVLEGRPGIVRQPTLAAFVARRDDVPGSSRALGWDTMLPTSSCGTLMSSRAFGHTGFTGTSLWLDPAAGSYVVLLTNRTHPDAGNDAIKAVRPALHDAVVRGLELTGRAD